MSKLKNMSSMLALLLMSIAPAVAQSDAQQNWTLPLGGIVSDSEDPLPVLRPGELSARVIGLTESRSGLQTEVKGKVPTFPTFKGTIAVGRQKYSYTMVGSSPFLKNAKPVVVSVPIIPVALHFSNGTVLDPTAADNCLSGSSALDLTLASPLFQNVDYGEGVGRQFIEEVRRLEFWSYTGPGRLNPGYSVRITPKVLPTLTLSVSADAGITETARCGLLGRVSGLAFDGYLRANILPQLPRFGVGPQAFPVFLLLNTVTDFPDSTDAGYHTRVAVGGQTYGVALFDSSGQISPDVSVLSHEIAEWYDDPYLNNSTPAWGHVGQVDSCQNNLEVGDPLTGVLGPPIKMPNGFVYHLQETAFFSWFFRQAPSSGVGGWYSSFGTFLSPAEPCSSR